MVRYLVTLPLSFALAIASIIPSQDVMSHNFDSDTKVPVELGVMSRCSDALLCESVFDNVLRKVSDKVDLSLRYVAKLDDSEPVFGVKCLHGPQECAGNVQQLCVAKYSPSNWWEFVLCQNYHGKGKIGQRGLAVKCASAININWNDSKVGECAGRDGSGEGVEGIELLQESVVVTDRANITCTIVINGEKVCVHDGTWKECENGHTVRDFVRQINNAYELLNRNQYWE